MSLDWKNVNEGDYVGYRFDSSSPGMEDVNGCFIARVEPQVEYDIFGSINLRDVKSYTSRNQLDDIRLEHEEQNFDTNNPQIYQIPGATFHMELLCVGESQEEVEYFFENNLPEELI